MLEDWDRHRSWTAHVAGATTLLQLRGLSQFNYERGAQLYMQLRSQIVSLQDKLSFEFRGLLSV